MKKILKHYDTILWIILVIIIFGCNYFLPKSGKFVLLDEFFNSAIILLFLIFVIVKLISVKKSILYTKKIVGIIVIVSCLVLGVFFTKGVILDVFSSTLNVQLHNVEVYKYQKRMGMHYYLKGKDSDNNVYNFEISSDDYSSLSKSNKKTLSIEYYKNTKRVRDYD